MSSSSSWKKCLECCPYKSLHGGFFAEASANLYNYQFASILHKAVVFLSWGLQILNHSVTRYTELANDSDMNKEREAIIDKMAFFYKLAKEKCSSIEDKKKCLIIERYTWYLHYQTNGFEDKTREN